MLVVGAGDLGAVGQVADAVDHAGGALEDRAADLGVGLHHAALLGRMGTRLQ